MTDIHTNSVVTFGDRRRAAPNESAVGDISPWEVLRGVWARKEIILCAFAGFMAVEIERRGQRFEQGAHLRPPLRARPDP